MGLVLLYGYITTFAACLLFGSQYVVLKDREIGDGLFYQWVVSCAILACGIIVNAIAKFPTFYPLAMLGGCLWASGNIVTVPMFHFLGVAPSFLIWTSVQMIIGWASGRFGWFGTTPQEPASDVLNYIGLALSIIGGIFFIFLENTKHSQEESRRITPVPPAGSEKAASSEPSSAYSSSADVDHGSGNTDKMEEFLPSIPRNVKRALGLLLALYAGTVYGFMFVPVTYIQNNYANATQEGIPYAFSYYSGVFLAATFFFLVYCVYRWFRGCPPWAARELILPSFIGGAMWGVAQACWLYANAVLEVSITTPIMTRLPGVITALWGVFLFREIRGRKNYIILVSGTIIVVIGSIFTGLSLSVET
jgi:glucose uptake protein GlcU